MAVLPPDPVFNLRHHDMGAVNSICFHNADRLFCGTAKGAVYLWDLQVRMGAPDSEERAYDKPSAISSTFVEFSNWILDDRRDGRKSTNIEIAYRISDICFIFKFVFFCVFFSSLILSFGISISHDSMISVAVAVTTLCWKRMAFWVIDVVYVSLSSNHCLFNDAYVSLSLDWHYTIHNSAQKQFNSLIENIGITVKWFGHRWVECQPKNE